MKFRLLPLLVVLFFWGLSGEVSAQEPKPADPSATTNRVASWLKTQDKDKDGQISRRESVGAMKANFTRNDTNKDGQLDQAELQRLSVRLAQNAARQNPREQKNPLDARKIMADWMALDKDGDKKLSSSEADGRLKRGFSRIDKDGDKLLSQGELQTYLGYLVRRANQPPRPATRQPQTMSTDRLLKDVPDDVVIEPDIFYRQGGSKAWQLDLVRPKAVSDGLRPGIVFIHGGGWRSGDKRKGVFLSGAIEYAQRGYVCITVNYRLVDEARFPACVEDVKTAVRWFRAHAEKYQLDPTRIGGFGNSAGAHLVAMLGLTGPDVGLEGDGPYRDQSSLLQAVCASATPTDFLFHPQGRTRHKAFEGLLGGPSDTLETRAKRASPIHYARATAPPFLLIHGTADKTVDVAHSDRFLAAMQKAGAKDITLLRIERAGHGVFVQQAAKTKPAMEAFFRRTLRAPPTQR